MGECQKKKLSLEAIRQSKACDVSRTTTRLVWERIFMTWRRMVDQDTQRGNHNWLQLQISLLNETKSCIYCSYYYYFFNALSPFDFFLFLLHNSLQQIPSRRRSITSGFLIVTEGWVLEIIYILYIKKLDWNISNAEFNAKTQTDFLPAATRMWYCSDWHTVIWNLF